MSIEGLTNATFRPLHMEVYPCEAQEIILQSKHSPRLADVSMRCIYQIKKLRCMLYSRLHQRLRVQKCHGMRMIVHSKTL